MTIALNVTDQEAEAVIEACKTTKGNPVLWMFSNRLQSLLDEERERQAEADQTERENRARAAWHTHLFTNRGLIRCSVCANALRGALGERIVQHMLENTCAEGKILYQVFVNSCVRD